MASGKGPYYTAVAIGGIFVYAGVRGYSVLKAVQNLIQGKGPNEGQFSAPLSSGNNAASNTGGGSSNDIAGIAESWIGKLKYVFGGPPPIGTVDCSSFASKCLNQAGISNPGGAPYSTTSHGPNTLSYLAWKGATTIGHNSDLAQRNDLCVWQTHMGICTGPHEMVSAQDPQLGVGRSAISPPIPGEILFVRRLV